MHVKNYSSHRDPLGSFMTRQKYNRLHIHTKKLFELVWFWLVRFRGIYGEGGDDMATTYVNNDSNKYTRVSRVD